MVIEGNKEESYVCIEKAKQFLKQGNREKALKFVQKAHNLYPSDETRHLLGLFEERSNENYRPSDGASSDRRGGERPTGGGTSDGTAKPTASSFVDYTTEQIEFVKKVVSCGDYYEVLGIPKSASESDIKKAYRKLALLLHPDKNKAPGAGDAFKKVGKAFSILSDSDKRSKYDKFGDLDQTTSQGPSRRYYRQTFGGHYQECDEDEIDPDEIFRMFFGGGFPSAHVQRRAYHRQNYRPAPQAASVEANFGSLIQLLPLLILVFVSLFSHLFVSDPPFSLQRSSKYSDEFTTTRLGVPYFCKPNFYEDKSQNYRQEMERRVEDEYLNALRLHCMRERGDRERLMWQARVLSDRNMYQQASNLPTESCDRLHELSAKA